MNGDTTLVAVAGVGTLAVRGSFEDIDSLMGTTGRRRVELTDGTRATLTTGSVTAVLENAVAGRKVGFA